MLQCMVKRTPIEQRFWKYIKKTPTCWLWVGRSKNEWGYGVIGLGGRNAGKERVHRLSWMMHNGAIPPGLFVLHKCDVPACIRPDHLFLGTAADNMKDCLSKNRINRSQRTTGEKHYNHKVSLNDVIEIRRRRSGGEFLKTIAADFNITVSAVHSIAKGKNWKHTPVVT